MAKAKVDKSRQQGRWNSEFRRGWGAEVLGGQLFIQILARIEPKRPSITSKPFKMQIAK